MITLNILFGNIAETSFWSSFLIAPLLLLRPWLRRTIGSQWLSVLWVLVAVRLLFALPIESRWSLTHYWQSQAKSPIEALAKVRVSILPATNAASSSVSEAVPVASHNERNFSATGWATAIWLAGVALGVTGLGLRLWKTCRLTDQTWNVTDARTLEIFQSIPAGVRRNVQLRETRMLDVPTLAGVLRPQIWLPLGWERKLAPHEMRQVLLHELGHACRHDLLWQWLFAVMRCVHWFNPLVWFFVRCARFDREMACDAWVLTRNDGTDPAQYGTTLLKTVLLLSNPLRTAPAGVAMATSKQNIIARIAEIGAFCPRASWRGIVGAWVVLIALVVLTTSSVAVGKSAPVETRTAIRVEPSTSPTPSESSAPAAAPEIAIEAKFIEFSESTIAELTAPGGLLAEILAAAPDKKAHQPGSVNAIVEPQRLETLLRDLNKKKGADLLSTPKVNVRPGQEAKIEIIREFAYVTEWGFDKKTEVFTPTAFGVKNVGVMVNAKSTIEADGKTLTLHAVPQIVDLLGFRYLDTTALLEKNKYVPVGSPSMHPEPGKPILPVFSEYKLDTTCRLLSGQTAVLKLEQEDLPGKDRFIVVFVTPKIHSPSEMAAPVQK